MINTLNKLYQELDLLVEPIKPYCSICGHHCCRGYIMLLKDEAATLLKNKVSVLEYNLEHSEDGYMLDTFPRCEDGKLKFGVRAPICPNYQADEGCQVYSVRPLVCRLYPIDIQKLKGRPRINWVVHKKCDFISGGSKLDCQSWLKKATDIVNSVANPLLKEIAKEWEKLSGIMTDPPEYELYILGEFNY